MNSDFLCRAVDLYVTAPAGDRADDLQRFFDALAQQAISEARMDLALLRSLPFALKRHGGRMSVAVAWEHGTPAVLSLDAGDCYGIACDLGTTNLVCSLIRLADGECAASGSCDNPQILHGADVLSRAQYAMAGHAAELTSLLLSGINRCIREASDAAGIDPRSIMAAVLAGNTIMSHSALGLDIASIPMSPFLPVVCSAVCSRGAEAGLGVHDNAAVYVFPNAGSYVGGDIVSGIMASGLHKSDEPVVLLDVGTNVEIVVGCRDWIMVGAGAAGPALESGIAEIGMKTGPGVITRVELDSASGRVRALTEDGSPALGICATSLIDLIAGFFLSGIVGPDGRFTGKGEGFAQGGDGPQYKVCSGEQGDLVLLERELLGFMRSKAAMFAFLQVFLRAAGLSFRDIGKYHVAGALGCNMNVESAVTLGMLPDIPRDRIVSLGNSSLRGAEMLLRNRRLADEAEEIREKITYRAMSEEPEIFAALQAAMFIPHTDPAALRF